MDSKLRIKTNWSRLIVLVLIPYSLLLVPSCKTNDWADWKVQNEVWLENNKTKDSVQVSSTGLQYKIKADPLANNGEAVPNQTGTIICDYTVKLINGYQVDGGNYVTIDLSNTIPGFSEGCHKIHSQGDIELYIPAYLGYDYSKYQTNDYGNAEGMGVEGAQSHIPPYSTLIYTVHICGIVAN